MEKFPYSSYPDSTESSPRSREIDFDNPPPWDDQNNNNNNNQQSYKVKFMCSYGGKIQPRPHDNQLTYVNGETKILSVDRSIRFSVLASKLAAVTNGDNNGGEVTFKYQLPGEDLDALISVTNDDDLEHMMHEYDRLVRISSKPARMRLFLFPVTNSGFGSQGSTQSDRDRFVDALNNTVPSRLTESEKSAATVVLPPPNSDFLFGSDSKIVAPPPPPPSQPLPVDVKLPVPVATEPQLFNDPRLIQPDPVEFQRLQIRDQEQQHLYQQEGMYRRKSNEDGGYFSPPYVQNPVVQPRPPQPQPQPTIPQTSPPVTFWQGNHNNTPGGGVFPTQGLGLPEQQQQQQPPVYMIPTPTQSPASVYHAPPQPQGVMRPQGNQGGYYPPVQRMAQDVYREQHQPAYNMAQSQPQVQPPIGTKVVQPPPPVAFTSGPPPPQYSAVPPPRQVVGLPDTSGYTPQVAYTGGMGKQQVYYTEAPPPPLQPQQYHGIGLPVSGGMTELRTGPDGKIVAMNIAPKVSSQNSDSAV